MLLVAFSHSCSTYPLQKKYSKNKSTIRPSKGNMGLRGSPPWALFFGNSVGPAGEIQHLRFRGCSHSVMDFLLCETKALEFAEQIFKFWDLGVLVSRGSVPLHTEGHHPGCKHTQKNIHRSPTPLKKAGQSPIIRV